MTEPFIENLEDHQIVFELPEVPVQLSKLYPKLAGEKAKIILGADAAQADKAVELVETVPGAGAGRADKAVDLVETVLEAGAGRADKAIDLVETVLEAGAGQAEEAEGPKFESKLHLWLMPKNLTPKNSTRIYLKLALIKLMKLSI